MNEAPPSRWNVQTIVAIVSIGGVLVAGGAAVNSLQRDTGRNTEAVAKLSLGLEQNDSATAQLELRMKTVEAIAEDASKLRRELDGTMAQVKADLAVIKATLARMEKQP
jgi:membrane-bound ClpP family serine protease